MIGRGALTTRRAGVAHSPGVGVALTPVEVYLKKNPLRFGGGDAHCKIQ